MGWAMYGEGWDGRVMRVGEGGEYGVIFYNWYMVVKEFYGEKIVDKHCHKDEQVYWDKFSSIHNK